MTAKQRDRANGETVPVMEDPGRVRNVVLVGHAGVGKTTLAEALLAATGTIDREGTVVDGNTVCDHDAAAIKQQRSVALSCAPLLYGDVKINLLDAPGYGDFVGELRAGLRAADAALFVVSAVGGMDAATRMLWQECAAVGMPRAVAITRLDHPQADFDETLAVCRDVFGDGVAPVYLPMPGNGQGATALIGLLSTQVYNYADGYPPAVSDPADADLDRITEARNELIEGIIAESEDETLMDRYLGGESIDIKTLIADLETAVARASFYPVIPVNAPNRVGLDAVLEVMAGGFPSPLEHRPPPVTTVAGAPAAPLSCDPHGPLAAEVVKTTIDPFVGRVSLVRVFSGTLTPETVVHVSGHGLAERGHPDHDTDERVAHIYSPLGVKLRQTPRCVAGDICAITKSGSAETGDTISAKDSPLLMAPWSMPEPQLPVAVVAGSRADEDAMAKNLGKLVAGDPTLRLDRNAETGQIVLWCMGEAHADVVLDRLRSGGTNIDTEPVKVALRETFTGWAEGFGRHVKQSGGHGQYGVCRIEVEPLPRGDGFDFVSKIVGGVVPQQFVTSVRKGVQAQMQRGLLAEHPVIDLRVKLVDGKTHSVDSSDAAFQAAGALALRDAATKGALILLEPVDEVAITVPGDYVGNVMSDLSARRAKVLGTETDEQDYAVINAEIPALELLRYTLDLRSMTSGAGTFTRTFARYEPMPKHAYPDRDQ